MTTMPFFQKAMSGLGLLVLLTGLSAQNPQVELQRLSKAMAARTSLQQQLVYTVFKGHTGQDVLETHPGSYARNGNAFRLQVGEIVTIQDGVHQLVIDPDAKTMALLAAQPVQATGTFNLEQWLSGCKNVLPLPAKNGRHGCRLVLGPAFGAEVEQVEVWYDPQKWLLLELTLCYTQEQNIGATYHHAVWIKPRIQITYTQTEIAPQFKPGAFGFGQYLVFKGKKASPTSAFKSWQFQDLSVQN